MPHHKEEVESPYSKKQLFDLVCDIEKYPEFLPWCKAAKITKKESENLLYADLTINFKAFFHSYTSRVKINEIENEAEHFYEVDVVMVNGPFKKLLNNWRFYDLKGKEGSLIKFSIDLEMNSVFFNKILNFIFEHAYQKMVSSFTKRAEEIYNNKSQIL